MKLVASVIARNEADRYLHPCLEHLLEFVDEIVLLDDGSTDATEDLLGDLGDPRIIVHRNGDEDRNDEPDFFLHANGRNRLLHLTLERHPTYVLAVDADEFVSDGQAVRRACEAGADAVSLEISEVWEACADVLCVRQDGGWRSHPISAVWRPDRLHGQRLGLADKQTATGRVPDVAHRLRARPSGAAQLHFGWTNRADRLERFKRYPPGSGHANQHVESIMWPDSRVTLEAWAWPPALDGYRPVLLERANRG